MSSKICFWYVPILIYAAYKDMKTLKVEKWINIVIFILALLSSNWMHLIGALIITVPFLCIAVKTNHIGGGDIKFIFVNACMLGIERTYMALIIGFSILSFQYLILKLRKYIVNKKKVPLLPYLVAGFLLCMMI